MRKKERSRSKPVVVEPGALWGRAWPGEPGSEPEGRRSGLWSGDPKGGFRWKKRKGIPAGTVRADTIRLRRRPANRHRSLQNHGTGRWSSPKEGSSGRSCPYFGHAVGVPPGVTKEIRRSAVGVLDGTGGPRGVVVEVVGVGVGQPCNRGIFRLYYGLYRPG